MLNNYYLTALKVKNMTFLKVNNGEYDISYLNYSNSFVPCSPQENGMYDINAQATITENGLLKVRVKYWTGNSWEDTTSFAYVVIFDLV